MHPNVSFDVEKRKNFEEWKAGILLKVEKIERT
jgi:hypothetical protein